MAFPEILETFQTFRKAFANGLNNFIFFFQSNLNGHPNLIGYVDSSVTLLDGGIHEVLLVRPLFVVKKN